MKTLTHVCRGAARARGPKLRIWTSKMMPDLWLLEIYIDILIYRYIYKYIFKKRMRVGLWACILLKRTQHSVFFCIKMLHSCILLRSLQKIVAFFAFFYILCVLLRSYEKNAKEHIVLLGLISRQKLEKERKRTLRSLKECQRMMRSVRKRTWCPTLQNFL